MSFWYYIEQFLVISVLILTNMQIGKEILEINPIKFRIQEKPSFILDIFLVLPETTVLVVRNFSSSQSYPLNPSFHFPFVQGSIFLLLNTIPFTFHDLDALKQKTTKKRQKPMNNTVCHTKQPFTWSSGLPSLLNQYFQIFKSIMSFQWPRIFILNY